MGGGDVKGGQGGVPEGGSHAGDYGGAEEHGAGNLFNNAIWVAAATAHHDGDRSVSH